MPKQRRQRVSAGETARWVAKGPASASGSTGGARPEKKRATGGEQSLEDFRHGWPSDHDEIASWHKDYYFNSYAHFGIHEDMLKDQVRTGSYMKAILGCRHLFAGKTVLDVGSGTGILCLFAAKAGAKRCIGIECSEIAQYATAIARQNGFGDVITYIRGKVEEVELPVPEVDIIISEWMGYFLIYESMLDSVLFARDKWLRKDGLLFPDHARLHVAAIEDADYKEDKIGFWSHVWGFDFTPMQDMVIQEPVSDIVDERAIASTRHCFREFDLHQVRREDMNFLARYAIRVERKDLLHALVVWFDVSFRACSPPVTLSTAPGQTSTHWKQTVLYLDKAVVAHEGDTLSGFIAVKKSNQNPRDLDVKVSFEFAGQTERFTNVQYYRLR